MSIRDFFKPKVDLPNPDGPLKQELKPSTIRDVNKKVSSIIEREGPTGRSGSREPYIKLTPEQKAMIGRTCLNSRSTRSVKNGRVCHVTIRQNFIRQNLVLAESPIFYTAKITRYTVDIGCATCVNIFSDAACSTKFCHTKANRLELM